MGGKGKEIKERKDSLAVLKEACLAQDMEKRKWKTSASLPSAHGCLFMSASLGHKGKIHFFLKSGLFCRNSYTLPGPELYKNSLQDSL